MSNIKRPGRGETEEDLLQFQQEFLANQKKESSSQSSTCFVNVKATDSKTGDKRKSLNIIHPDEIKTEDTNVLPSKIPTFEKTKPKSRFKAGRDPLYQVPAGDNKDIINDKDNNVSAFLTQIVERDTKNMVITVPKQSGHAFPPVYHRQVDTVETKPSGERISIFAQQFVKTETTREETMEEDVTKTMDTGFKMPGIVRGSGLSVSFAEKEVKKIHQENIAKLGEMTETEILEEQKKLFESIDPKVLAFLKKDKTSTGKKEEIPMDTSSIKTSESVVKTEKQVQFTDDDIPVKREKGWMSMENIEYDKLEWIKELPDIKTEDGVGKQARFDLDGNFIVADASIPVHKGLHHHGDEPERAGYSLEELFHLARSSNIPQRALALNLLAKILIKCKEGEYAEYIKTAILPTVLNAGIIFLLRWALDDSNESIQMAAVFGVYSLICNTTDQNCLDSIYCWYQGLVQPSLICPPPDDVTSDDNDEEKPQESDDQMARRDLVQALVSRMMLIPRLKYLLVEKNLSAPTIVQILSILTRVAYHSPSTAYEIVHFPGILKYIFTKFLPSTWISLESEKQMFEARSYPLPEALKFMAAICKAGKNMTAILMSTYNLQDVLQRYIAVPASDLQLPESVAVNLQKQSYIVWKICLSYGLAGELYLNLYSVFMKNLQSSQQAVLNNKPCEHTVMISTLESVLHVAALPKISTSFNNQEEEMESDDSILDWSNISSVVDTILPCLTHHLQYIGNNYQFQKIDLEMVTCLTNFMASYFYRADSQIGYNPVDTLKHIEKLCEEVLTPFWKSLGFRHILVNISEYSNILSDVLKHEEVSSCLPSYGASCLLIHTTLPILKTFTPIGFLTAYLRLISSLCRLHKGIIKQMLPDIVDDKDVISYMRKICQHKPGALYSNYFTKYENIFQYQILKLCSLKESSNMSVMHHASLQLLTRLQHGDEYLIHDLFSYITFSPQFLSEARSSDEGLQSMADLQLTEVKKLKSATQEEIILITSQLMESARNNLLSGSIKSVYITIFSGKEAQSSKSRERYNNNTRKTESLLTGRIDETLLPHDWMFLPLVELYNMSAVSGSHYQDHMPAQNIRMVGSVLEWIFLLECERPEILRPVSVTLKLSRIMCTFLAGNNLFLEKSIRSYLAALLREYTKPVLLPQIDFTKTIPGLASFFDLYQSLLEQYSAVSFGDSVFGSYLLIPLQQCHSIDLRLLLWGEHHDALRALLVSVQELLLPIERYLEPDETDASLLQHYFTHLTSQLITPIRTPVPYLIAVHHVNRFLYFTQDSQNTSFRRNMWSWVKTIQNEKLKNHIIHYKKVNTDSEFSMDLYTDLPTNRQQTVHLYLT
ncbi:RNA polymerase II-associated protein 1 isoform X2 [Patella vulgata]|uniref:RNA polymerase II-associated protein 1 isoform X2 n=1 Tax=Patella vulgata TaxID=6465 RepID=UPI002180321E|nr:RNA polymerase II-associated protein 1 isoform X2 [Patella vulgata]